MQIKQGKVVSFHYTLNEKDGEVIESSDTGQPMLYLHGYPGLLDALQEGLEDHEAGQSVTIDVPAERAYGLRKPDSVHRVPLKHVALDAASRSKLKKGQSVLKPGDVIRLNTPEGERDATVVKAGKFNVDVDTNHPLAGKDLVFKVEVVDVRESTDEERQHGHAHGPGGHQH